MSDLRDALERLAGGWSRKVELFRKHHAEDDSFIWLLACLAEVEEILASHPVSSPSPNGRTERIERCLRAIANDGCGCHDGVMGCRDWRPGEADTWCWSCVAAAEIESVDAVSSSSPEAPRCPRCGLFMRVLHDDPRWAICDTCHRGHFNEARAPSPVQGEAHSDTCVGRVHDSLGCSCGAAVQGAETGTKGGTT